MIGIIGGSGVEEISELADATETKVLRLNMALLRFPF